MATFMCLNIYMFKQTVITMALAGLIAPAFAAEWGTDFPAAQKAAAEKGKMVLVNFTGSDWCGYCIRLKKTIFDKPAFDAYVADKFELVEVDLPRANKLTPEQFKANQELAERYEVQGFPTIMVMAPDGTPVGGFGGALPNQEMVAQVLDAAYANGKELVAAAPLTGEKKLQALIKVYRQISDDIKPSAKALRDQILAADTNNVSGLKDEVAAEAQMNELMTALNNARSKEEAQAIFEKYTTEALPMNKAFIYRGYLQFLLDTVETEADLYKLAEICKTVPAQAPELTKACQEIQALVQKDAKKMLEEIKKSKN